ncbi:MAG: hypothetical protein H0X30_23375 [Anaerolineae bacterium]|nr:hypothetical protein [Anaerolineae bacterium]
MTVQPSRRTYAITLFLLLLICYGYFLPKWADWGANSRADMVYAFGDKGTLKIDDYHTNTGDLACFPGPFYADPTNVLGGNCTGSFYSDKSLGPSLLALPFYMVFKGIAALPPIQKFIASGKGLGSMSDTLNPDGKGIRPDAVYQYMALAFITFFASAVPSAFLGVIVFLMAARFARKDSYAFLLALAFGLATMAFPYSNALYQHQLAGFGAFTGFYLLWRVIYEKANLRWLWVVGILFSFAAITEYPVVPGLAIIFLWALWRMPNRTALYRVILGALPLMIVFAAFNYAAFNTIIPLGYKYSTNWQSEHETGFLSLQLPSLDNLARIYGLTFSPIRGIFITSPFLLLAIWGFYWMWQELKDRRGAIITIALFVAYFFFYNSSSVMWWGGFTIGPRYLIPMLPFFALPIIFAFNRLLDKRWGQILVGVLIAVSAFSVWAMNIAGQQWPDVPISPTTAVTMTNTSTLLDYSLPLLAQGKVARNYAMIAGLPGFASLIPLLIALIAVYLIVPRLFNRRDAQQQLQTQSLKNAIGGTD